jgi:hypothetical protein
MSLLGQFSAVLVAFSILLGLLGLFAAMGLFARNYIKVPPSTVAIFYGRKHVLTDEKGNRSTVGFASSAAAQRSGFRCSSRSRISRSTSSRSRSRSRRPTPRKASR